MKFCYLSESKKEKKKKFSYLLESKKQKKKKTRNRLYNCITVVNLDFHFYLMIFFIIIFSLRIALIQDSVQVRAVGLRALRYTIKTEEDVLNLNRLHFPYLISRYGDIMSILSRCLVLITKMDFACDRKP